MGAIRVGGPWMLVATLVLGALGASAPPPVRAPVRGTWQMVIASPERPWIFIVHFEPKGSAWAGRMILEGYADFPLQAVRVDSDRVRFRLPPELDSLQFDGRLEAGAIVGAVRDLRGETPTRLTRIAPLPRPANRIEAWQQDLDVAAERVLALDRSFAGPAREAFRRSIARVKRAVAMTSDAQILVGLARAVALAGNAHTRLRLDPTRGGSFTSELPIRIWWFSDGPYVVRAAAGSRRALGCRVVAINGHDVGSVRERVDSLFAGNVSWAAYLSPLYFTSPDVDYGLGLIQSMKGAFVTFEDARGDRFDLWIPAKRVDRSAKPGESWQELSPLQPTGKPSWSAGLPSQPDRLPRYLRHPEKAYWLDYEPQSGLLYFQFNRAGEDEAGPSLRVFGDSLRVFAGRRPIKAVVLDLRFNSGGDLTVGRDVIRSLARDRRIDRPGRLFVVTGICTFSAGLYHAAQLRQLSHATIVGEPVGDRLDFWAEGGRIVLPNSRASIEYANGFHRYSGREYPDRRPYYQALAVSSLGPDVSAPLSSRDYFAGRDPALEAIEARLRIREAEARRSATMGRNR